MHWGNGTLSTRNGGGHYLSAVHCHSWFDNVNCARLEFDFPLLFLDGDLMTGHTVTGTSNWVVGKVIPLPAWLVLQDVSLSFHLISSLPSSISLNPIQSEFWILEIQSDNVRWNPTPQCLRWILSSKNCRVICYQPYWFFTFFYSAYWRNCIHFLSI